jgi:LCP family protein required for cell wall assembly
MSKYTASAGKATDKKVASDRLNSYNRRSFMPHKKPFPAQPPRPSRAQPKHDPVTRAGSTNFPAVGMTMSSYKHSPFSTAEIQPKQIAKVRKPGKLRAFLHGFTVKRVALTLALVVLVIGVWVGGKFVYNTHRVFGGNILGVLTTAKLKGEDRGQVNILLAGNSSDDVGHDGGQLTDSIMLLSIDTRNHKAYMMSIPRDLWVNIGNDGYNKINFAYVSGLNHKFSQSGFPDGGMGQLESIVEQSFGVNIDYYALINYQALKNAVDAVGGIDFNVQSSDKRGLYDPNIDYVTHKPLVKLTNGIHHIDGEQALDISRARGDSAYSYGFPRSDFDRTENQRKLLVAREAKAITAGVLASPTRLSSLSDALGNNVKSDITISEVRRMYDLIKDMKSGDIASVGLNSANGKNLLASYQSPDGQSALVPAAGFDDYSDIKAYIKQITSSDLLVREASQLVILNGTNTVGLASQVKTKLQAKNITVLLTGDGNDQAITQIVDDSGGKKPATIAYLKKLYPKATVVTTSPYTQTYNADIILVLGTDAVPKTTTPSTSQ